jgi:2-succinyl-5-enolpyruvyl-6-hydroxy-3-cyclohexene-1-carboxylate synthase
MEENMSKYTSEKNILILISLLKKHGIKKIIASPGTTNISFVASVQSDDFFEVYSCVDERSAAYLACGMSAESGEPVVLTCTGATASRNYFSGLTEAYYRKLPIIAITATQHLGRVGQNVAQVIDRSSQPYDTRKKSIQLTSVHSDEDAWACNLAVNDILLEARRAGGGPVHINMVTTYSNDFTTQELPNERKISRYTFADSFPKITSNKVAIMIGNHKRFSEKEEDIIDEFCEKYNGVVLCDQTSNYNGKYKVLANLVCAQESNASLRNVDLLLDIGNVSGGYIPINPKEVWRINEDGEIRDQYKRTTNVFEMPEIAFFESYNNIPSESQQTTVYYDEWRKKDTELREKLEKIDLPFSNIWVARNTIEKLEEGSIVHLGILNTLRSWNYCNTDKKINFFCNTGGFGIDGITSAAIGASLATDKTVYCFLGDLAFFYDLNSIGNRELKNNLKILLVNNGSGTEFHNYNHRATLVSESNGFDTKYFAADSHFGNKHPKLVKDYAENLGFRYLTASNKKEFEKNIESFIKENGKPVIFEIFTNPNDESEALRKVNNLSISTKSAVKNLIGQKNIAKIKKILGR